VISVSLAQIIDPNRNENGVIMNSTNFLIIIKFNNYYLT
jgi:hypothetical protein